MMTFLLKEVDISHLQKKVPKGCSRRYGEEWQGMARESCSQYQAECSHTKNRCLQWFGNVKGMNLTDSQIKYQNELEEEPGEENHTCTGILHFPCNECERFNGR